MAFQMAAPNRQPPPAGLSLNLSSNNPFRNRAVSPSPHSASALHTAFPLPPQPPARPMSRNPFLDDTDFPSAPARSGSVVNNNPAVPDDIFRDLSLLDRPNTNEAVPRAFNGAQVRSGMPPPPQRPQRPDEPRERQVRGPPRAPEHPANRQYRPRRASESSVMERERRPRVDADRGEMRERTESSERRRRERREERHRREKEKIRNGEKSSSSRSKKPRGLDIIDKLDVTGIYGQGLFHHDGPFDACNPHRNAKKDRRAPMEAFPAGSANMALGGSGPVSSRLDLDKFHGRGQESFSEYAATRKVDTTIVDPTLRAPPVHGEETYGLGTSTFLDGAPASKTALQRRVSEDPAAEGSGSGLSRKKSIAQRFRGMSGSRPNRPGEGNSPPHIKAVSAGGLARARYNKENEVNPFENDYEPAFEKKGTQIRIAEQERPSATNGRGEGSPKAPLGRSRTSESDVPTRGNTRSSNEDERSAPGGGFLSRMKSLKGGNRRPRNDAN
ncbi:uncharacterized protein RCC_02978 [Ramularia collo-cygni]|uniref:Pal1 cell morphology protein n=1 Tax=Ramularia collo-cygni TaxID=112498 RepID=A0A2D3V0U1_9PEZI|nr:uncharacterized protein RCC_02978 [Ramularia collo-cygni]CZT17146.1 uncharacterized protein RCC_02978 [Ramularia collo-cygni]